MGAMAPNLGGSTTRTALSHEEVRADSSTETSPTGIGSLRFGATVKIVLSSSAGTNDDDAL